ncbi:hypothetical protein [Myxococcus landrumensis]|uniref:Lipoprotein n=1 Tax=Myxococcus landrumensis TaxID=2813577 RepID=A0ABX7N8Y2_9BACT|nr:hypothetical protein [Myxococcus landrumus]QSQ14844.1 hypothetical protein JY572_01765 [Myxococcus landrumus]
MKTSVPAVLGLCLWLATPGAVLAAQPRALDFAQGLQLARLRERASASHRARSEASRPRAFNIDMGESEDGIPMHVWLVPLILTGVGLVTGITACAADYTNDDFCQRSILTGLVVGAGLGLGYLGLVADSDTDDLSGELSRPRSPRDSRKGQFGLPLGLAPSMGVVQDRAVLGLGGHF